MDRIPQAAVEAFLAGTTHHTRRVELYEADGSTIWRPDVPVDVVNGNVSISYGDNERRTLDLTLSNSDGLLQTIPNGLWYDKIVKVYRGVELKEKPAKPVIGLVAPTNSGVSTPALRRALADVGYPEVRMFTEANTAAEVMAASSLVIGLTPANTATAAQLTAAANVYKAIADANIPIITIGEHGTDYNAVIAAGTTWANVASSTTASFGPRVIPHAAASGWTSLQTSWLSTSFTYRVPTVPTNVTGWTPVASMVGGATAFAINESGSRKWGMLFIPFITSDPFAFNAVRPMLLSFLNYFNPIPELTAWETQIGEFMIDRISQDNFPNHIKITGRDYVKKCSLSKFAYATQFATGLKLESIIGTIAASAGVTKRVLPTTTVTVAKEFYFDRGVTRWEAMHEIASAYNYDIFFDAQGYLTLEPIADPATQQPIFVLRTGGDDGSLVSFTKSTTDTRIYNSVVVTGESSDTTTLPVFAVAKNTDPNSPTSIAKLGERLYQYTSSWITTTAQAQTVANSFLAVHALEEFEVSFESLMLPWLDAGDVIGFEDPDPNDDAPNVLLLSELSISLEVKSMSGTGKRVVKL